MCHNCATAARIDQPTIGGVSRRGFLVGSAGVAALAAGLTVAGDPQLAHAMGAPTIASTKDWGAKPPTSPLQTINARPEFIVIHHTDTPNSTDYSVEHAYGLARAIQNSHIGRGWQDSGQHFTISRGGHIMEGRTGSLSALSGGKSYVLGAHAGAGNNTGTIGIEHEGNYMTGLPPEALWDAMVTFTAYCCQQYAVPVANIVGHRNYIDTDCPGDALYAKLSQLRTEVAKKLGTTPPPTETWPVLKSGATGFRVKTLQYQLRGHGQSLDADGSFGPATLAAVKKFQTESKLSADGVVGPKTWTSSSVTTRSGDRNDHVRGVQTALVGRSVQVEVDGSFGPGTVAAVKKFQTDRKLEADGVVGPLTWCALVAA